jgi:hypothetical protein
MFRNGMHLGYKFITQLFNKSVYEHVIHLEGS